MNTRANTKTNKQHSNGNDHGNKHDPSSSFPYFSVLINPGNPSLSGVSKFSYFPIGGPEPRKHFRIGKDSHPIMGYVTSWGGMEVGKGMSFASNTVDGIVHQHGGKALARECQRALSLSASPVSWWWERLKMAVTRGGGEKDSDSDSYSLPEGMAIATKAVGKDLQTASGYESLVHTVPPFFDQNYQEIEEEEEEQVVAELNDSFSSNAREDNNNNNNNNIREHNDFLLAECYRNSLLISSGIASPSSSSSPPILNIASPLLGAGCRGFPTERAIEIAANTTTNWMTSISRPTSTQQQEQQQQQSVTLAFGIPDGEIRKQLIDAIDREMEKLVVPTGSTN